MSPVNSRSPHDAVPFVLPFAAIAEEDLAVVGGKAHSLARMARMGLPVPGGFAVTAKAYSSALEGSQVASDIHALLVASETCAQSDVYEYSGRLTALAQSILMPPAVENQIVAEYCQLAEPGLSDPRVAVRSSALSEDGADTSFAGEYDTYLDVEGAQALVAHVRRCWASLFSPRALSYARSVGKAPVDIAMAVVVQKMTRARSSGVMFTLSPKTGDRSRIFIESAWGLGLSVVGGEVTPDQFILDKISGRIVDRVIARKTVYYDDGETSQAVAPELQEQPTLSDDEVTTLAEWGTQLERRYGCPVDIEWAVDKSNPGRIAILQCRAETVWSRREAADARHANTQRLSSVLLGLASQLRKDT